MQTIKNDFKNTVFSFIPNTAEIAFYGMVEEVTRALNKEKRKKNTIKAIAEYNSPIMAPVKKGDKILFGKWSGTEVTVDGDDLIIMKESDILGIIG